MDAKNEAGDDVAIRAADLVAELMAEHRPDFGMGSMSCNVYDAAWVACVSKRESGSSRCLFPATLQYVLDAQTPSGCFPAHPLAEARTHVRGDNILATLASLFMLGVVGSHPQQPQYNDFTERISKAASWLTLELALLRLDECIGVGFELLVPALLELLEYDGFVFEFPAKAELYKTRAKKLGKLKPEMLYGPEPSAIIHSLEAFYGSKDFDFDKVSHHKVHGSMMNSPSATAAYLMRCTEWDNEAEAYLHRVVSTGAGKGSGGVPSAFPSTNFELLWVTSTILHAGISPEIIGTDLCEAILVTIGSDQELVGFASGIEPDLDDSARSCILRCLLDQPSSSSRIEELFSKKTHFATYRGERNPSLSANCNALIALLLNNPRNNSNIPKIADYVCDLWWRSRELPQDKWNVSPWYTTMLVTQALTLLLRVWEVGNLPQLAPAFLRESVVLCLFQCMVRTLQGQRLNGSWDHSSEVTAYCILTLAEVSCLPLSWHFQEEIASAIDSGRRFIRSHGLGTTSGSEEYLWMEKVTYGSPFLHRAYTLAALFVSSHRQSLRSTIEELCDISYATMGVFMKLSDKLPILRNSPRWLIVASWIESRLFLPRLRSIKSLVFQREGMSEDKYFDWIPFTWTAASNINGGRMSSAFLFEMMTISFLNYQADEFMEVVVDGQHGHQLQEIGRIVDTLLSGSHINGFKHPSTEGRTNTDLYQGNGEAGDEEPRTNLSKVVHTLEAYVSWVMHHNSLQGATHNELQTLRSQLKGFLHAHITQAADNRKFAESKPVEGAAPNTDCPVYKPRAHQGYHEWVRTTSAQHTSCPFSFEFAICMCSAQQHTARRAPGLDLLETVEQRYFASDVRDHLATMCRMYNDHGSLERDRREWNLNSVNFVDFHTGSDVVSDDELLKKRLFQLAQYERACLQMAFEELRKIAKEEVVQLLRVFTDITDLFGQIYVVKDIASQRN